MPIDTEGLKCAAASVMLEDSEETMQDPGEVT
jgi:hypothetical protein